MKRFLIKIEGLVEGVGFRPFVYRVAKDLGLGGWIKNNTYGVEIEIEGKEDKIDIFLKTLREKKPKSSEIFSIKVSEIMPLEENEFKILPSSEGNSKLPVIPPDLSVCDNCKLELLNPEDKRYLYPFINCTECGPRFSIIEDIPYDRENTSMKEFKMCEICRDEYKNIFNRRFHAQPIACFECGPHLELLDNNGKKLINEYPEKETERRKYSQEIIKKTSQLILEGNIVAIKGIGGFQLVCRADNDEIVKKLRQRKRREEKPFAVMFRNLEEIERYCYLSEREKELLTSYISPILLLKKKDNIPISEYVAPRNPFLGCLLPYSPLHILLMEEIKTPVIFTSGNLSDEPICIDNQEALERLNSIADYFLIHNRKIVRHIDDSVIKITPNGNEIIIRRARGFVPKPIIIEKELPITLAVGGHLKNTVALSINNYVILSQHIGDLETFESIKAFEKVIKDFLRFFDVKPEYIISDLHPDYISTQFAEQFSEENNVKLLKVQHHLAHILSVMAENHILQEDIIGVSWDGTGYGLDGEIWGSEFFYISKGNFERIFHLLPIPLIGGEKAIKETFRIGIGLLLSSEVRKEVDKIFGSIPTTQYIIKMYDNGLYVKSSGAGRLFDGVSSIIGISRYSNFEGQSAMELEFKLYSSKTLTLTKHYSYNIRENIIDWRPMIKEIVEDINNSIPQEEISIKFHNTIVKIITEAVEKISIVKNCKKVVLSGGVFQNSFLVDKVIEHLEERKFKVYLNKQVPPNDGGISLGQIVYPYFEKLKNF